MKEEQKVIEVKPEDVRGNELVHIVKQSGLEETKGQMLLNMFKPFFADMANVESKIKKLPTDNPSKADMSKAILWIKTAQGSAQQMVQGRSSSPASFVQQSA